MTGKFWYWESKKPRRDLRRDYAAIEEMAEVAGVLSVLRAFQNDLVYAFDDLTLAPDGRMTFYGKRTHSTFVPLLAISVDRDRCAILAELAPELLLSTLGLDERMLPELLSILPDDADAGRSETDNSGAGNVKSSSVIAVFRDAAQVLQLARFLGRRFGGRTE